MKPGDIIENKYGRFVAVRGRCYHGCGNEDLQLCLGLTQCNFILNGHYTAFQAAPKLDLISQSKKRDKPSRVDDRPVKICNTKTGSVMDDEPEVEPEPDKPYGDSRDFRSQEQF